MSSEVVPPTQTSERLLPTISTAVISAVRLILVAPLNSGYGSALKLASGSVMAIAAIGIILNLREPKFGSQLWVLLLFLVAVLCLTVLGASRLELQRQLVLLREITSLSNPHFGVDRTIGLVMEKLRSFYAAASCVLIMAEADSCRYRLWRVDSQKWDKGLFGEPISEEFEQQLCGLSSPKAVVYSRGSNRWFGLADTYCEIDVIDAIAADPTEREGSDKVATMLEAESLLAVPIYLRNRVVGRFYLASENPQAFVQADAKLVYQMIMRILPLVDNMRLADRLASEASERERTKMAWDIHDSIIQPYVGIQLGLTALRRKIQRGEVDLDEEFRTLMEMTDGEIFGLRRYMAALTGKGVTEITLLESVRNFAREFSNVSGIPVEIRNGSEIKICDRLAEEAFQMIAEGLSNIRRHTRATQAIIQVACDREYFALRIEDRGSVEGKHTSFIPRSITARARALGGEVQVEQSDSGGTAVNIKIPL